MTFVIDSLPRPCPRVLNVGCGLGVYLQPLAVRSSQVVGIELNYEYLCKGAKRVLNRSIDLAQMNVHQLAFADRSYDAAIMIETLEHIPRGELAIREISRVLKPGGGAHRLGAKQALPV